MILAISTYPNILIFLTIFHCFFISARFLERVSKRAHFDTLSATTFYFSLPTLYILHCFNWIYYNSRIVAPDLSFWNQLDRVLIGSRKVLYFRLNFLYYEDLLNSSFILFFPFNHQANHMTEDADMFPYHGDDDYFVDDHDLMNAPFERNQNSSKEEFNYGNKFLFKDILDILNYCSLFFGN